MATTRIARKTTKAPVEPVPAEHDDNALLGAFRSTLKSVESATLSISTVPLGVLSGLGVSETATATLKGGTEQMVHGVTGSLDTIATGSFKVAGKGYSLLTGAAGALKP